MTTESPGAGPAGGMKVAVAVGGKWDMFQMAEQLERRGCLETILTSMPRVALRKERVSPQLIRTVPAPEVVYRVIRKLPFRRAEAWGGEIKCTWFDRAVARRIPSLAADLVITMSSFSVRTLAAVRRSGKISLLSRNNCHIRTQKEILDNEARRLGLPAQPWSERVLRREEQEYADADHIRVPSETARRSFLDRGFDPARVHTLPHGVDVRDFVALKKADNVFRILYVGTLSIRKGIAYLLEAVSGLKLANTECVLVGPVMDEVRPILASYSGVFRHIPPVPQRELSPHYSQGSVYVFPSLEEGMAASVVEAMACGLPVIVSDTSGVDSVVRDGTDGFIFRSRDVQGIRERIVRLYENEELRREMARSAEARARTSTWDQYGDNAYRLIQTLLARSP